MIQGDQLFLESSRDQTVLEKWPMKVKIKEKSWNKFSKLVSVVLMFITWWSKRL